VRTHYTRRIIFSLLIAGVALSVPAHAVAQRAVPRPGVVAPVYPNVAVGARYGYGYGHGWSFGIGVGFGFAWYPFYGPWYPYYGYGYPYRFGWYPPYPYYAPFSPYYPYYGYGGYAIDAMTAALRIDAKQRDADVYVDGYLAGNVDQFDGTFQRLRLRPGEHDLVLYRDGMKTVQQHLYLGPGSDQKLQLQMVPLAPGETSGPRPTPPPPAEKDKERDREQDQPRESWPRTQAPTRAPEIEVRPTEPASSFGSLALLVRPADAQVLVDGVVWNLQAGESRLTIRLPDGRHKVEVRKAGFETYTEEIAIQRGRTLTLNVSLIKN
jgi:hypothetical protein